MFNCYLLLITAPPLTAKFMFWSDHVFATKPLGGAPLLLLLLLLLSSSFSPSPPLKLSH